MKRGYFWRTGDACRAYLVFALETQRGVAIALQQVKLGDATDITQVFERLVNGLREGGWSAYLNVVEGEMSHGSRVFLRTLVIGPQREDNEFYVGVHDIVLEMLQQDGELVASDIGPYSLN